MTHNNWEAPKAMSLCRIEMCRLIDTIVNNNLATIWPHGDNDEGVLGSGFLQLKIWIRDEINFPGRFCHWVDDLFAQISCRFHLGM